ncbi:MULTISPECIES: hypothetical protein [unclassified Chelatococcus]|jgi:hypothetical protein|uniref:hypothetical protein n=1 Tax=unclassified Chelatococcus TaxID=2638111 RepID=UPI001BCB5800|nr:MULTISPECIES: hypothetical protein [unclassified Chelatococcus]CAH1659208.1 conserved hypothetical protein [Hyphomicrobiales bacterium]MBS7740912.1 hypothetical protein [Chelatococcus sp. HY11]MBX3546797.1 hypothetical protein [Chelatococcus sp.]MCO5077730.1 hypothetical protein [Chelatococcus sp.]CAH1683890.1 conserved hypothetical protein [Hyphomicrobiales bacterium]
MTGISRRDIDTLVGTVDDMIASEMIGTGASAAELAEAMAHLDDHANQATLYPSATRRVRRLIDLLLAVSAPAERLEPEMT